MKARSTLLAIVLSTLACNRLTQDTPELDPVCKRACNETNERCRSTCDEPTVCVSRCNEAAQRCLAKCAK